MLDDLKPLHTFAVGVVVDAALCLVFAVASFTVVYAAFYYGVAA